MGSKYLFEKKTNTVAASRIMKQNLDGKQVWKEQEHTTAEKAAAGNSADRRRKRQVTPRAG